MGKSKVVGVPSTEPSRILSNDRLTLSSHLARVAGISQVPKAAVQSEQDVIKDLLQMEAKLRELGFTRDGSHVADESDTITNNNHNHMAQSTKLSSALGESYMVLKPKGSVQVTTASTIPMTSGNSKVRSSQAVLGEPITSAYGGGNTVKIRNLVNTRQEVDAGGNNNKVSGVGTYANYNANQHVRTSANSQPTSSSVTTSAVPPSPSSWTSTVMAWGWQQQQQQGALSTANNKQIIKGHANDADSSTINWSEQSVFDSSQANVHAKLEQDYFDLMAQSVMNKSVTSNTHNTTVVAKYRAGSSLNASNVVLSRDNSDDLSKSTIDSLNREAKHNSEGVVNLLQTVKRLGDENTQLLIRIEHLSQQERQTQQKKEEMEKFISDFNAKFTQVKKVLREYSVKYPSDTNPASRALKAVATASDETAKAKSAAIPDTEQQSHHKSSDGEPSQSAAATAVEEKRRKDLERTVYALVSRLQKANEELKRKDDLLRSLDPNHVATQIIDMPRTPPRASRGTNSSSSSSSGSSINDKSSNNNGIAMGLTPGGGVGSSHSSHISSTTNPSGMSSPMRKKAMVGSSSAAVVSKHSSVATYEALQKGKLQQQQQQQQQQSSTNKPPGPDRI